MSVKHSRGEFFGLTARALASVSLFPARAPEDVSLAVNGVAGDVKESLDPRSPLRLDPRPTIYRPFSQEQANSLTVILRTGMSPLTLANDVRRQVAAVDPNVPVMMPQTVRHGLAGPWRRLVS